MAKRSCLPSFLSSFVCLRLDSDMVGVIHCRLQGLPHSTLTEARLTRRGTLSLAAARLLPSDRVTRRGPTRSHSPQPAVTRSGLLLLTEARVTPSRRAMARDHPRPRPESLAHLPLPAVTCHGLAPA